MYRTESIEKVIKCLSITGRDTLAEIHWRHTLEGTHWWRHTSGDTLAGKHWGEHSGWCMGVMQDITIHANQATRKHEFI